MRVADVRERREILNTGETRVRAFVAYALR
jgi:hypothetical protein